MKLVTMQRIKELIPYSHDHQHVLSQSLRLKRAALGDDADELALRVAETIEFGRGDLADHMHEEEAALLPLAYATNSITDEDAMRVAREHLQTRVMLARLEHSPADAELALEVANQLHDHVRWEERELFAHLQEHGLARSDSDSSRAPLSESIKQIDRLEEQGTRSVSSAHLSVSSTRLIEGRGLEPTLTQHDSVLTVTEGSGTLSINDVDINLSSGQAVVIPAETQHSIVASGGGLSFTVVHRRRSASPALPELPQ